MTRLWAPLISHDKELGWPDRDVLYVAEVDVAPPWDGEVLVGVRAAGINPGEVSIRTGALAGYVSAGTGK